MKNIKIKFIAVPFLISIICALLYLFYHNNHDYTSTFFSLDTVVSMRMSDDCIKQTKDKISEYNNLYDVYSENSQIHKLNLQKELLCSDELTDIVKKTTDFNELYGNNTDISSGNLNILWHSTMHSKILPDNNDIEEALQNISYKNISVSGNIITLKNGISIDLGSVAKGYILDELLPIYQDKNMDYSIVSMGSSTLLYSNDKNHIFNVAVKSSSDSVIGTVHTKSCFVSTSGDYERYTEINNIKYHHIIDLKTGFPADSGLSSVTVFADNGLLTDFLSTSIFVDGKENIEKHLSADNYKVIATDKDGNVFKSESLDFQKLK